MEFKGSKGEWYQNGIYISSEEQDICEVFLWDDPMDKLEGVQDDDPIITHKANSQLIFNAPEMLKMLERIMLTYDKGTQTYIDCMELLRKIKEV